MKPTWFDDRVSLLSSWAGYSYSVEGPAKRHPVELDANENWHVPASRVREEVRRALAATDPRKYPDESVSLLSKAIAKRTGVTPDSVIPCSGGDQAIDLLCQGFLSADDRAIIVSPTFSMYRLRATLAGGTCVEVPMRADFTLPRAELKELAAGGGLLFVCSPNNPTGTQFAEEDVLELVGSFSGLVILDEAYVEFADFSVSKRVSEFRNLAVLRTFSKAYGMAGLRLGYILANDSWAPDFLDKVQYPYPISSLTASVAVSLMKAAVEVDRWSDSVRRERDWLSAELAKLEGVSVADSKANFVMASLPVDSERVHAHLVRKGIATRNLGTVLGFRNCLRITVGTRSMNRMLLKRLEEVI